MKERLSLVLFWVLVLHVLGAVAFIIAPTFLRDTRVSVAYKKHVLPGPFFNDSQLVDNYSLAVSWKVNGLWTSPINISHEDFRQYHASMNPTDMYRSRLSRTLLLKLTKTDTSVVDIIKRKGFSQLNQFLYDHYVPREADSVKIWIINNRAKNFEIKMDSLYIIYSR